MNTCARSFRFKRAARWGLGLAALILLGLLAVRLSEPAAPPPAIQPVPVHTVLVQQQTVPVTVGGIGSALPVMSVTVKPRVDGQLESVEFKEGQDVQAGQVLVRIDPRAYKAQLDQLVAQKLKDDAQLANARTDLKRYQEMIRYDAATRQQLDTQTALVRQLEATIASDTAQIEYAQVNLSYTTISAPISGRVGARLVDPGNIVHASDADGLLVINQIDPIAVQFTLPEADFQAINAALKADEKPLRAQALERNTREVLAEGELVLVNNQIDTSTGTIMLKAHFPNPEHKLWPGQSVDARVRIGSREQALTVPDRVLQRGQSGYFAYLVDADGKVSAQPLEIASSEDGIAVVTKGLKAGDRVVLDGQYRLMPGSRVVEAAAAKVADQAPAGERP